MGKKKIFSNKNIVALFIVFLMVSSIAGYMFGDSSIRKETYNGYIFILKNNLWVLNTDKGEIGFNFFPSEFDMIEIDDTIASRIGNTLEIDMTYDENDSFSEEIALAQYEFGIGLDILGIYLRPGFIKNNSFNMPVITCDDVTLSVPVIYLKESNKTEIYLNGDCIIAEIEKEEDAVKIIERILYDLLGVIK